MPVRGTGACRRQWRMKAGGASEIARSDACVATMRVSRTEIPCGVKGQSPLWGLGQSPNAPRLCYRISQTHDSPLSPKAVYGGECERRLRAPQNAGLFVGWRPRRSSASSCFAPVSSSVSAVESAASGGCSTFGIFRFAVRERWGSCPIPRLGLCPKPHKGHCPLTLLRFAPV